MAYRLKQIIDIIEQSFPTSLAMDWDNPGLIIGSHSDLIEKVLVCLDADERNVGLALSEDADLILAHHPMILFNPIKKINDTDSAGRKILSLIENHISVYACHTNYDIGRGGMGYAAAKRLGVSAAVPLEVTAEAPDGSLLGVGFVYESDEILRAASLASYIKQVFSLQRVWYYDAGRPIRRIAVCPGSGRGMEEAVLRSGADAFICGDTGHHDGLDYKDAGVTLIDAGHYGIEHIFMDEMTEFLGERFPELEIYIGADDERIFV